MANGGCLCGEIQYEYSGEPTTTALCHCLDCRKWTGAAFTSNVVVPRSNFAVVKGHPKEFSIAAASGKINRKSFCATCGSSLYSELEISPDLVFIKSGGLHETAADHPIAAELYVKDRLGYTQPVLGAEQKAEL